MSRSKVPASSKEMTKNPPEKTRSSSVSQRENAVPRTKLKTSEDTQGPSNARKLKEASSILSKEPTGKVLQRKDQQAVTNRKQESSSRQLKSSVSKPATVNHSTTVKPRSDHNVVSRNHIKEQSKTVSTTKSSQALSKNKVKEPLKTSLLRPDPKMDVPASKHAVNSGITTKVTSSKPQIVAGQGNRLNRERTKTHTINPEDSQLLTALQHAAQKLPQDVAPESSTNLENEYEDDFEDYESDFEEVPSLDVSSEEETDEELSKTVDNQEETGDDDDKENYDYGDSSSSLSDLQTNKEVPLNGKTGIEEKKMDSGHYDMTEERRLPGKHTAPLVETSKNVPVRQVQKNLSTGSLPAEISKPTDSYEVKVINFAQAKRRQQERKASSKQKHRGEILLNMIRLDSISFPLFDMAPVPYEIYMRSYGRSNTQQASCQTNEDHLTEEVQTDEISSTNKWTQHPPALICPDEALTHPRICSVSSDPCDIGDILLWKQGQKVDVLELEKFVLSAGQLMLNILEETSSGTQGHLRSNKVDLGFSQGFIVLGTDSVPFLKNRQVSKICFVPHQSNSLLTVHQSSQELNPKDDLPSQMVKRCLLCIWSLLQPSQPLKILVSSSDVTACTFHPLRPNLVFAGLADGLLNVWNLKEQTEFLSEILFEDLQWTLKSPSYTSVDHVGVKHSSTVVGIQVLDSESDLSGKSSDLSPTQICSLDESGLCIIWTLLSSSAGAPNVDDVGVAPWGCVRLVQNESFTLAPRVAAVLEDRVTAGLLQFADLALDSADPGHMLAAANTGLVAHSLSTGTRAHPAVYPPDWDCLAPATCICPCPFGLPYFLVGCGDGTVRLHGRLTARPLLSVAGSGGAVGAGAAIVSVQWSTSRPCVFFALDSASRLHVWDLASSDMYPVLSVPFKGRTITTMQLSPSRLSGKACPYLALGTSCGRLKVHLVRDVFATTSIGDAAMEMDKFKRYVSIL